MPKRPSALAAILLALLCSLALLVALPRSAAAQTTIAGGNINNATWTMAGSPYIVQGDIVVPSGGMLTIQAGVEVQFASGDGLASGLDASRVEMTIRGTLNVNGTAASPVVFRSQSGAGANGWYGVVVDQPTAAITTAALEVRNAIYGFRISAAEPTLSGITAHTNGYGVYYAGSGGGTLVGSVIRNNSNDGVYVSANAAATMSLDVTNCTVHANGLDGISAYGNSGATVTVNVTNSIITQNLSDGIYRTAFGGTVNVITTYSDVWGNSGNNYSGASAGAGSFSSNPLYVGAPGNLRLTSNSPARFAGDAGGDIGALPYAGDPTSGLLGVLWANQTLGLGGSPYSVTGDLTVAPGVTLTVQPGVVLRFASGDAMGSGQDASRGELIVQGTLSAAGTPAQPVTFDSANAGANSWWGIALAPTSMNNNLSNAVVTEAIYGVWLNSGSQTINGLTAHGNGYGVRFAGAASGSLVNSVIRNNSNDGVYIDASAAATMNIDVTNCTVHANGLDGISAYGNSGANVTVNVTNSIITQNLSDGIYRTAFGGTVNVNTTYSDVWGNSGNNYSGASAGAGSFSSNPLYVGAPGNLRLTSNSPARFAGDAGGDIGALPYTGDPTSGLLGVLWTSLTLNLAGSPYSVTGDLTVAPGVTLTVQPGVVLRFASGDAMSSGQDASRGELIVRGTLSAAGTPAQPVTFDSANAGANSWWGIALAPTSMNNNLANAVVTEAIYGVWLNSGSQTINGLTAHGNGYGVRFAGAASGSLINSVIRNNSNDGVYIDASAAATMSVNVTNCTVHANGLDGISVYGNSGANVTVDIRNSIVTQNLSDGIYRTAFGGTVNVSTTYSDVWGNSGNNYSGAAAGAGCISANPLYEAAPANLKLQSSSFCVDSGTAMGAPAADLEGTPRPLDGDGINGTAFDMGAYEYALATVCGDGILGAGESCDEGPLNGQYGHCNASCTGPGPFCGDGIMNGPEQCDDGNASNADACLNTCVAAACGDGFVRAGVEQCDDGNMDNADACLATCVTASCGDGYTWAGMEQCDDGNMSNTDACVGVCADAACGDGYVRAGVEACDDGNQDDTDACRNNCSLPGCGDGVVQAGEACDDGNQDDTDACLSTCLAASCGDGFVRAGVEACDDGNTDDTDECVDGCVVASCGDGFVRAGVETCDDGNTDDGDGCSAGCMSEGTGGGGMGGSGGAGGGGNAGGSGGAGGGGNAGGSGGAGGSAVSGGGEPPAGDDGGCGCRAAGGGGEAGHGALLMLAGLVAAAARRRRRAA